METKMQNSARAYVSPYGWLVVVLLFFLGTINFADKAVLGLAAVPIIKEFHLSPAQYGLVSGSLFWLFPFSSVLVTAWSDRTGTKKVLALLASSWALVQFATIFVASFAGLLITRIVLGVGEGPSAGTSASAAAKWLPLGRRAFGQGVIISGSAIGPAVFAPFITFLIASLGWRSAFAFLGIAGTIWVGLWLLIGRERPEEVNTIAQETPVALHKTRWVEVFSIICSRNVIFSLIAAFAAYWETALLLNWTPVYLITIRRLSLTDPLYVIGISLPWIVGGISLVVLTPFADYLFLRTRSIRRSHVYVLGLSLIVNAIFLYLAMIIPSTLGAVFFLAIIPAAAAFPITVTIITALTPITKFGAVLGVAVTLVTLPGFIAPMVTGLIIQAAGKDVASGFTSAYLASALLLLVGGACLIAFVRPDEAIAREVSRAAPGNQE